MSTADDRDLQRYLERGDALSRAYAELKSERPSPALDQAVLARARDALTATPPSDSARRRNWYTLTALAATVLLSFGLVMRLALEPDSRTQPATPSGQDSTAQTSAESTAPAANADQVLPESDGRPTFAPPPRSPTSPLEESRAAIESEIRAATEQVPAVPEPVPPSVASGDRERAAVATPAQEQPANAAADAAAAPAEQSSMTQEGAYDRAPERGVARAMKSESPPSAPMAAERDVAASSGMQAEESFPEEKKDVKSPEVWLAEIAQLRAAGEHQAAERELERFRKVYPDYLEKLEPHEPARQR